MTLHVLDESTDLDNCKHDDCRRRLPFFDRTIAHQRGVPQECWTCQRKTITAKEALHRRIVARSPTVMRVATPTTDPVA